MAADNVKRFEFRLGKWGLTLFVFGMSLVVFFSFLYGVKVGKEMDAYPEKYSWGIPEKIGETLGGPGTPKSEKTVIAVREAGKANPPSEKSEYDLSVYDTLSKKSNSLRKPSSENGVTETVPVAPVVPPGQKVAAVPAVPPAPAKGPLPGNKPAGGKKEERAAPPPHGKVEIASQGKMEEKSVAKAVPEKAREVKTPAEEKKAERKSEKAIPAEKKSADKIEKIIAADKKVDKGQDKKEIKPEDKGKKPAGQTFMIQVGSYKEKDKAEQVVAKLKSMGYAPRLVPMELPGKGKWYRLTIGGFSSHEKAAEAVTNVAKSTGSKGFVRPEGEAKAALPSAPKEKK
ncbi:MAG: cell division protein DedD [Syntrophus sp. PtaU1.Bin208]|nr:MAG: cell division protein DedD [Syntrophus sp. PtaU1.Bin208]